MSKDAKRRPADDEKLPHPRHRRFDDDYDDIDLDEADLDDDFDLLSDDDEEEEDEEEDDEE